MRQVARVLSISCLILLFSGAVAVAAASTDLKATSTASGQTTLVWTYQGGDVVEYSLDGLTWSPVAAAGGSGVRVDDGDTVDGKTRVIGLEDYRNYYFLVSNGSTQSNIVDAFPPDEHAHKYFADDTNQCARCHSTHEGTGARLTKEATIDAVCNTCHVGGTGSKYQVEYGTVVGPNNTRLTALGGLFGTEIAAGQGVPTPTSVHQMGQYLKYAPGGDMKNANGKWSEKLSCGSCHSAHSDNSYQYRLLKNNLPNMKVSGGEVLQQIRVEAFAKTSPEKEVAVYVSGMNDFCGGCHADYNTRQVDGSGHTASGVFVKWYYRHAVGKDISSYQGGLSTTLPLEKSGETKFLSDGSSHIAGTVSCITCHQPHGVRTTGNMELLRRDNLGVCQDCHQK